MRTRMQPIGTLWAKFPRLVRDLALACGKQVRLDIEGEDTELDKTLIEAIRDPLTHLVRNAVDHGIEPPGDRAGAGKPPEGVLRLRAFHEGGQVVVEVSDDGGGIDPARVRAKAVAAGLVTTEQAARMSDREALNLIFLPGFSTAERVTKVSGRGVGMDVVRTNIERIGGTVDVQSRLGAGTTFKIKIPLTLAIIPALLVAGGGRALRHPAGEPARAGAHRRRAGPARPSSTIHGAPVYRLRGRLLPLVSLGRRARRGRRDWRVLARRPDGNAGDDVPAIDGEATDGGFPRSRSRRDEDGR